MTKPMTLEQMQDAKAKTRLSPAELARMESRARHHAARAMGSRT